MSKEKLTFVSKPKEVDLPNIGKKEKIFVKTEANPERMYACLVGKWNRDWKAGDEVEFGEVEAGNTTKDRDGKDVTWYSLKAPESARFKPGVSKELEDRITKLEADVVEIFKILGV